MGKGRLLRSACLLVAIAAQLTVVPTPALAYTFYPDLSYGPAPAPDNLLDVYVPAGAGTFPAIVVVHGGGWIDGDKMDWEAEAIALADAGFVAVTANFRTAPENLYPAALLDLQLAVAWLRDHAATYSIDPENIGALGGSSGAHLSALLAMKGKGSQTSGSRIAAAASWSGRMDFTLDLTHNIERFLGCPFDSCPRLWKDASPFYSVDSSDPALYLANSTSEVTPLYHATNMASKLGRKGVPYVLRVLEGSKHSRGYEDEVWDETVQFFHEHLGPDG
jgi:acetyl esterase